MKVYLVEVGQSYEPSYKQAIASTKDKAEQIALEYRQQEGDFWVYRESVQFGKDWSGGGHYVTIKEFEVQ